ncbi:MAG TPA: squalene--hopene cyclase [Bryobacteraceae bacterium]|jgi:squalene-hopene/tetraprenyl-beta-curcumene cyclase
MSSPSLQIGKAVQDTVGEALRRGTNYLLSRQSGEGYWWADLTADSTLESDFVLVQLWLHPPVNGVWKPPTRLLIDQAVQSILDRQLPDGGFNIYAHGPSEISATVKAYTALKLGGVSYDHPSLARARERIHALGGLQAASSYVKINLSLFGLFPREHAPAIPPELILFGNFIYQMSSWTRAIVMPLSILHAKNPQRPVPAGFTVDELLIPGAPLESPRRDGFFTWRNFFVRAEQAFKVWERWGSRAIREKAIRRVEQWVLAHTEHSGGLGAIYPSMMYTVMMLELLGYPADHPARVEAERQFMNLLVRHDGNDQTGFFFQPCYSVVWDTGIVAQALGEAGAAPRAAMQRAADWLLSKEVRRTGDWSVKRPNVEPSGWYFEFANEFYPDIDDTAQVLLALAHACAGDGAEQDACIRRALNWLLAMQGKDGGWAAFDVDNDWNFLKAVPFADHNAMLDPACPDITGRVLEALAAHGFPPDHPAVKRGIEFLQRNQEIDGSWYGRWGVDYIYGTFLALRGLRACGEGDREAYILRAGEWLRAIQNADGGWGESCASYDNGTFTPCASTPSQTAWAILGLLASGDTQSSSVQNGVEWLLERQRDDGRWDEEFSTGTGFPRVFYLKYHLYRNSFPVLALAAYRKATGAQPARGVVRV